MIPKCNSTLIVSAYSVQSLMGHTTTTTKSKVTPTWMCLEASIFQEVLVLTLKWSRWIPITKAHSPFTCGDLKQHLIFSYHRSMMVGE